MNIAIIGATGNTGNQVLKQLLNRGHGVKALVRGEGRIANTETLQIINGSATEITAVEELSQDTEVLIITVNAMTNKPGLSFHQETVTTAIHAIKNVNPSIRLFMQTSASHGLAGFGEHVKPAMQKMMKFLLDNLIADHRAAEQLINNENNWLHYTIFCPPQLADAPAVGGLQTAGNKLPPGNFIITYEDLGKLIADVAEQGSFDKSIIGINGTKTVKSIKRSAKQPLLLLWRNIRMKWLGLGYPKG